MLLEKSALTTPPKKHHWKWPLSLGGIIVIAIVTCEVLGWPFLRVPVQHFLSDQLEREVLIDEPFKLRLLGRIQLQTGGLWIAAPDAFVKSSQTPHFIDAKDIAISLSYFDLLTLKAAEPFRIKSLRVSSIDAQLIRQKDGTSTWQFAKDNDEPSRPTPIVNTLVVRDGSLAFKDAITKSDLKVRFDTSEDSADKKNTKSSLSASGKFRDHTLKGELRTKGFLPIATQKATSPPIAALAWLEYSGIRLDFDGTTSDIFGKQNINGKFGIKGASLGILGDLVDTPLPTTDPFNLKGNIRKDDVVIFVDVATATVGQSSLHGKYEYDPRPERPLLKGTLEGDRFYLADLAPAFGTRNKDGSKSSTPDGRTIPDRPIDLPSLSKMDAEIKVDLKYVELGSAFTHPISPFKANLVLDNSKLTLSDIDARTADGSLAGLISIDARQAPVWKIDLSWKDIDLEKWLQVSQDRKDTAKKAGKKDAPPAYVTGTLNGKTDLTGTGQSTAALLGSLDGSVAMYINNGSISHLIVEVLGLDIAQSLSALIGGDNALPMNCAVMDLKANKGILTPDVALIDTPVTLVLIDGDIDLAKENLNLRLSAKPKNFSPLTMRSPIRVRGPFNNPQARPEGGPIAARVIGGVALAFINPLAAILPFLDAGSENKSSCGKALVDYQPKTK
ncbi:AsmA family protein [Methylovorus sp. MM2]|uniref:AsmA family protein n=1 Tax=Methylovorus sp. MM2 TaxID=1848038 RepID=UPI0009EF0E57|nr:AsmA family protein [Methylovorus sp. MM2]